MKDVRGVEGTRSDGRTDGRNYGRTGGRTHTRTDEGHFYSPPPPTSGDKYYPKDMLGLYTYFDTTKVYIDFGVQK